MRRIMAICCLCLFCISVLLILAGYERDAEQAGIIVYIFLVLITLTLLIEFIKKEKQK